MSLYSSPLGLFAFQADGCARTYWQFTESKDKVLLALWDTGIGKSHLGMASAALLFEDGLVDQVLVIAEANKVMDWAKHDFPTFTGLTSALYAGAPDKRRKMLTDRPQVLVSTYETARNDLCAFRKNSRAVESPGMLTEALLGAGRTMIVFDEFSRLRSRQSKVYIAFDYLINRQMRRKGVEPMLLGLTATTVENNPMDHWNACRILDPDSAGSVDDFEHNYVLTRNVHDDSPYSFKNLDSTNHYDLDVPLLSTRFAHITIRKSKFDDDVIDHFPKKVENPPTVVPMSPEHRKFYEVVEEIYADPSLDFEESRQGFGLARQIVDHPYALVGSTSKASRAIVEQVGAAWLEGLGSSKEKVMLHWQEQMAAQQTVIFTFFGRSVLPLLHRALTSEGYKVSINHGGLSADEKWAAQEAYKAGDTQIFLTSDAGAKGLNLGCGTGLLHYEPPLLYSTYVQRSDRIHRIDSRHASVTVDTLMCADTVEVPIFAKMLKRNSWADQVQDGDLVEESDPAAGYLKAADRVAMLSKAMRKKSGG